MTASVATSSRLRRHGVGIWVSYDAWWLRAWRAGPWSGGRAWRDGDGRSFGVSSAGGRFASNPFGSNHPSCFATLVISTKGVREAMVEVRLLVVRAAQIAAEEMAATRAVEEIKIDLFFFVIFMLFACA